MLVLLHTSPVHVPTFDRLRDEEAPGLPLRHVVDEELLARAQRAGPDSVTADIEARLRAAKADGATAVLCTCSTIGGIAEAAAQRVGLPVLRVDRPMAAAAVAAGRRIRVLAALASTAGPTLDVIADEAAAAGREVETTLSVVDGAWERFEAGDRDGYLGLVASAIGTVTDADAIVLAQASMAGAEALATVDILVLSSPRPGFRAAVRLIRDEG